MYSLLQRLRSLRHGFWFEVSERLRWSRGAFEETPARELCNVELEQGERIAALRERYQVQFEQRISARTSANNYEYLDMLDRGWSESGLEQPAGGSALRHRLRQFLVRGDAAGILPPGTIDRRRSGGTPAVSRAGTRGSTTRPATVRQLPNARFVVADYAGCRAAGGCDYRLVSRSSRRQPLLAWRLPLVC